MIRRHPNLFYNDSELAALKKRMAGNVSVRKDFEKITSRRDELIAEPFLDEAFALSLNTQHGRFGEVGGQAERMIECLLPLAAVHNDPEAKQKLTELLRHLTSFSIWTGPANALRDYPWHSDLTTGKLTFLCAGLYDVLYKDIPEEERTAIGSKILSLGVYPLLQDWVLPETRIHALDSMGHNWWAVCVGLCGAAFLPLCELVPADERRRIIRLVQESMAAYISYPGFPLLNKTKNFDDQGLFYESVGYSNYGTGEWFRYLFYAERYLGKLDGLRSDLLTKIGPTLLTFSYPTKQGIKFLNYGDSSYDASILFLVRMLILNGYGDPSTDAYYVRTMRNRNRDFLDLLHSDKLPAKGRLDRAGLPETAVYPESGYYIKRSSYRDDAALFSIKSGFTWNHAHADAGSFMIYDKGVPLIKDSGTCAYGAKEYIGYYCQSPAHNVLLIGGQGQLQSDLYQGSRHPGRIDDSFEGRCFGYVRADVSGPMSHLCSRFFRNVWIIENRHFVIWDDLRTLRPDTLSFLLHFQGKIESEDGVMRLDNGPAKARIFAFGDTQGTVRPLSGQIDQRTYSTMGTFEPGKEDYLCFDYPQNGDALSRRLCHVISLGDCPVTVKADLSGEACSVLIREGADEYRLFFNARSDGRRMHINTNQTLDGYETDAYMLFRKTGDDLLCVIGASYVRKEGRVLFSAFEKTDCIVREVES